MKIRITKEFHFEMSHCLNNYYGLCKNIHGHSYKLFITLLGTPNTDVNDSGYGMVMDFTKLKKIVTEKILDDFDHSIVIEKHSPYVEALKNIDTRKNIVDFQPTCENLVIYFKERIEKCLPKNVSLYKVVLFETMTSQAEWNIEDNK